MTIMTIELSNSRRTVVSLDTIQTVVEQLLTYLLPSDSSSDSTVTSNSSLGSRKEVAMSVLSNPSVHTYMHVLVGVCKEVV